MTRAAGWTLAGVGDLNPDVVSSVLTALLPSVFAMPSSNLWGGTPAYLDWIVNAMTSSRVWLDTGLRTRELWGAMLPLARSPQRWAALRERAGDAPKRLLYEAANRWGELDGLLETASGVYAPQATCPWRDFGEVLQGRVMPHLEAILVRPNESGMPESPPSGRREPVFAPSLVVAEISSASTFVAWRLKRLVASNFWASQLRDAVRVLESLEHLEIHRTRSQGRVDWTTLLSEGRWSRLRTLIIFCPWFQSDDLPTDAVALNTPRLRNVDLGGAVLAATQALKFLNYQRVAWADLLRILRVGRSVAHLTVRKLTEGNGLHGLPAGEDIHGVDLKSLERLSIEDSVGMHTAGFFMGLSLPALYDISLSFDATGPPNRVAVAEVADLLEAAADMGVAELRKSFLWARTAFRESGYTELLVELHGLLTRDENGLAVPRAPFTNLLAGLRICALELHDFARATAADAPMGPHAGEVLRDVMAAVKGATGVDDDNSDCVIRVELVESAVQYRAVVEDPARDDMLYVTVLATGPPAPPTSRPSPWCRQDSLANGAARALTGLSIWPVVEIFVAQSAHDPFHKLGDFTREDVDELSAALSRFTRLDTLRFEVGEHAEESALLMAIEAPVMQSLRHIFVTREAMGTPLAANFRPLHAEAWFVALERAVTHRAQQGMPLEHLEISGHFCVCRRWIARVDAVVETLDMNVACSRRLGSMCLVCDEPPWW